MRPYREGRWGTPPRDAFGRPIECGRCRRPVCPACRDVHQSSCSNMEEDHAEDVQTEACHSGVSDQDDENLELDEMGRLSLLQLSNETEMVDFIQKGTPEHQRMPASGKDRRSGESDGRASQNARRKLPLPTHSGSNQTTDSNASGLRCCSFPPSPLYNAWRVFRDHTVRQRRCRNGLPPRNVVEDGAICRECVKTCRGISRGKRR